jgi:hypothetical protein
MVVSPEENSIATAAPHITEANNASSMSSLPAAFSGWLSLRLQISRAATSIRLRIRADPALF